MKPSYRFYKVCYRVARIFLGIFYGLRVQGKENIPEGAAMICANHSSIIDPFLIAFAFSNSYHLHFMAKAEIYKIPVLSAIMRKLGTISVDRSVQDMNSVKETLGYLNKGGQVVIFPEGTRSYVENAVSAKNGAVKVSEYAKAPILPVFIPRRKPLFRKLTLVIGEPYIVEKRREKRSPDEYSRLADSLMSKIESLNPEKNKNPEFQMRNSE